MNAQLEPKKEMLMNLPNKLPDPGIPMSEEDYLASEPDSEVRREYIGGKAYAMTGGSVNHNILTGNVYGEFRSHLKGKPCIPLVNDIKVPFKVSLGNDYVYPDVLVDCSLDKKSSFSYQPILIVEILSSSTRKYDRGAKKLRYINLPSLEEYVLIEQNCVEVMVLRKSTGWFPDTYYLGDSVTFDSIGLTLSVEEIYDRVENDEMEAFLAQQSASLQEDSGNAE